MKADFIQRKKGELLLFILIFAGGTFVTVNMNIRNGELVPPGRIWSDAAHYYVYMPATFIYHWDVYRFPYKIENKFAGFNLDSKTGKVDIKTTCGIAILLTPFFLMAHGFSLAFGYPLDGFSLIYQLFMMIGAVFYFTLALFFLKRFLDKYLPPKLNIISLLLLALTTPLYFYAYQSILMSHIYSFFLFSLFLYLLKRYLDSENKPWGLYILLCLDIALAVLVRPTNVIILLWLVFLDITSWKGFYRRVLLFLHPARVLLLAAIQFLILIPQFMYWKYISGHYVFYSYPGEIFFWAHPQIIKEWFSPLNGLFPYHPVYLLILVGMIIMIARKKINGMFTAVFFLLISYVISSWHCWYYGGSFGARPFTEYLAFMALPFAYFVQGVPKIINLFLRSCMVFTFMVLIYFNLMQAYTPWCFDAGTWEWDNYFRIMKRHSILNYSPRTYTYKNDFQNIGLQSDDPPTTQRVRSRVLSTYCDSSIRWNVYKSWPLLKVIDRPLTKISAGIWLNKDKNKPTGAKVVLQINSQGQVLFSKVLMADEFVMTRNCWYRVFTDFDIPAWIDQNNSNFTFYIDNPEGSKFYIDDQEIQFR